MSEEYSGTKFNTIFSSRNPPKDKKLKELGCWCRKFAEKGLAPYTGGSYTGNMSIRSGEGIIITAARANLADIAPDDFSMIVAADFEKNRLIVRGQKEPSSESLLHIIIYRQRPEINAVFHGHDDLVLKHTLRLGFSVTQKEQPYGTLLLAEGVLEALQKQSYAVMHNHGFVAVGRTMAEAGEIALSCHDLAAAIRDAG